MGLWTQGLIICRWSYFIYLGPSGQYSSRSLTSKLLWISVRIKAKPKKWSFRINQLAMEIPSSSIPFKISTTEFDYSAIVVTRSIRSLKERNLSALTTRVKSDLQRRNNLLLSLAGGIQTIEMNIMLEQDTYTFFNAYLFFFWNHSLLPLIAWFLHLYGQVNMWELVKPSYRGVERQGDSDYHNSLDTIGLPALISLWFTSPPCSWLQMETDLSPSTSLQALACSPLPLQPSFYTSNPMVTGTLRLWAQIRWNFGWLTASQSTPFLRTIYLYPLKWTPNLPSGRGLHCLRYLYIGDIFANFNQLHTTFILNTSHFFRYFQLVDFARMHSNHFPQIPPPSGVDQGSHL